MQREAALHAACYSSDCSPAAAGDTASDRRRTVTLRSRDEKRTVCINMQVRCCLYVCIMSVHAVPRFCICAVVLLYVARDRAAGDTMPEHMQVLPDSQIPIVPAGTCTR
jgi:hypothetical protein